MFPEHRSGAAALHVAKVRDRSTVISSWARSPLSILTPRVRGESVWAYTSSFGGGMVAGDETFLEVKVDAEARCFLSTQASTKIYRNPELRACSHRLTATLASGAVLIAVPDPVQCFAESSYQQTQIFRLADSSSLLLVDWVSSGRSARGERWVFRQYGSKNVIYRDGRLVLLDSLLLEHDSGSLENRFRTGRFNCLATAVLIGPALATFAEQTMASIGQLPVTRGADLLLSASPLENGTIVRLAGESVELVGRAIHRLTAFVPELLDGDPWARKW
jgi:urease accessory protein